MSKIIILLLILVASSQQFDKGLDVDKKIDELLTQKAGRLSTLKIKDTRDDFDIPMVAKGYAKTANVVLKGLQTARRKGKSTWATVKGNQQITIVIWVGAMTITGSYEVITDEVNRVNLKGKASSALISIVLLSRPNAKKGCVSSVKITKMTGFNLEVDSGEALSTMLLNHALESTKENYEPVIKHEIEKEIESIIKEELKEADIVV